MLAISPLCDTGLMTFGDGNRYAGQWWLGNMHGLGVFEFLDGMVYRGAYRDNLRHGCGVLFFVNGDMHEGDYEFGVFHGTVLGGGFLKQNQYNEPSVARYGARYPLRCFIPYPFFCYSYARRALCAFLNSCWVLSFCLSQERAALRGRTAISTRGATRTGGPTARAA